MPIAVNAMNKADLRVQLRATRDALDPTRAERRGRVAMARVLPLVPTGAKVAVYWAAHGEIATAPLIEELVARGHRIAFPRVVPGRQILSFLGTSTSDLEPSRFGLLEPSAGAEPLPLEAIDVFVVPALGFDRAGRRLGWGRGHYDATLAARPSALRIGFAFAEQIVETLPVTSRDEPMDWVVTDTELIAGRSARGPKDPA